MGLKMPRLRLISGRFGGRFIDASVSKATHPMGDRVRSGMFNSLSSMDVLYGANVLDAFAGTGAIGLEALSRGASSVTFIERDKTAQKILANNIESLGVSGQTKLIRASVANWMETTFACEQFDLIFCDPPYQNPQFSTVFRLLGYLKNNGLMILSNQARLSVRYPNQGVVVVDKRCYGEASLVVLRKKL